MSSSTSLGRAVDAHYALLDFGRGLRLEQWGSVLLIRPDPRATGEPALDTDAWHSADATYEGRLGRGTWRLHHQVPATWTIVHGGSTFEVKLATSMHPGLFPEQAQHWDWMCSRVPEVPSLEILNLFAHTGGASVALAARGHRVTHVDASRPAVSWARRNAALNGVSTIRWIEDDVRTFVNREGRRGRRYDGLLLDPPTFGRSARGAWQVDRDLDALLDQAVGLLAPEARFVLINTYGLDARETSMAFQLGEGLRRASHPLASARVESGSLDLTTSDGRTLPTGCFAKVSRDV